MKNRVGTAEYIENKGWTAKVHVEDRRVRDSLGNHSRVLVNTCGFLTIIAAQGSGSGVAVVAGEGGTSSVG